MKSRIFYILCLGILLSAGTAIAGDLVIGNYNLISKQRVSRTEYVYTYQADVTNNGAGVTDVTATLTSNSPNTVVVSGALIFGDVPAGGTVTSSDSFSIRQNRRYSFDEAALVWDIQGTSDDGLPPDPGEAGKATLEGIDSDNDGVRDDIQRYIALMYAGDELLIKVLRKYAIMQQKFLLDANDKEKTIDNAKLRGKETECLWYLRPDDALMISRKLKAEYINTEERVRTYFSANHQLSGEFFSLIPLDELEEVCN